MTAPQELRTPRLLLRSIERDDVPNIVRLAGAREVAATTLQIPHPYAENDAVTFLAKAGEDFLAGRSVVFAITLPPERRALRRNWAAHRGSTQARGAGLLDRCSILGQRICHRGSQRRRRVWLSLARSAQDLRAPLRRKHGFRARAGKNRHAPGRTLPTTHSEMERVCRY